MVALTYDSAALGVHMKTNLVITLALSLFLAGGVSPLAARQRGGHPGGSGGAAGRAAPRGGAPAGTAVPRGQAPHGPGGAYRPPNYYGHYGPGYGNGYYHYGYPYGYYRYGYPYGYYPYSFGLSFGYGYGYGYGYPYGYYPYPYYGYGYTVPSYGGVQITGAPRDADVYADGYYVGVVDDFDGAFQQINLEPGSHHIEIRPKGGQPQAFDVSISPGQKMTYRAN
jgi:hypothetical protein